MYARVLVLRKQIVVAMSVASWYFCRDKSTIGSGTVSGAISTSLFYHSGTAAFGSLIIAIIKTIRAIVAYIQKKTKDTQNKVLQVQYSTNIGFCYPVWKYLVTKYLGSVWNKICSSKGVKRRGSMGVGSHCCYALLVCRLSLSLLGSLARTRALRGCLRHIPGTGIIRDRLCNNF